MNKKSPKANIQTSIILIFLGFVTYFKFFTHTIHTYLMNNILHKLCTWDNYIHFKFKDNITFIHDAQILVVDITLSN